MSTPTIARHETAARFLAALAGWADPNELLELRYRLEDGQRMGQLFERPARLRGLATRALALGRRTDVYVGCAPRPRRHGGRDAVARAFLLGANGEGEEAAAAPERLERVPSIVVASGTGDNRHAYWPLSEPLPRDDVERANRRPGARARRRAGVRRRGADPARPRDPLAQAHAADGGRGDPALLRATPDRRRRGRCAARSAGATAARSDRAGRAARR